jgi:hypothetical protein
MSAMPSHLRMVPRRFGFGAKKQEDLSSVLQEWTSTNAGAKFSNLELVLSAAPTY